MVKTIINKENQAKLKVIAHKMEKIGFGQEKEIFDELIERFVKIQISKITATPN